MTDANAPVAVRRLRCADPDRRLEMWQGYLRF